MEDKKIAVCPGTFDPPTLGHLDVIVRGLRLFDEVIVAVAENPGKTTLFTLQERQDLLKAAMADGCSECGAPVLETAARNDLVTDPEGTGRMVPDAVGRGRLTISSYSGLTVDFVRKHGAVAILRGIRTPTDFDYELHLALTNRAMSGIETIFVMASERYSFITSTLIREIARLGGDVSAMVPPTVNVALKKRFAKA